MQHCPTAITCGSRWDIVSGMYHSFFVKKRPQAQQDALFVNAEEWETQWHRVDGKRLK